MTAGIQRPLRGSRISTFYPIKTLPSLSSLDSAFQLQEYISLLIRLDIHDVEAITSLPSPKDPKEGETQDGEASSEKQITVDEACWVYEQLRRLAQDLTHPLITTLQQECTRSTCPEMKAGEWLYLCVAHGNEGSMEQCCAIDYILHTLDSATALLSSPRAFPSRLQIPGTSHRHFSSLARRLGRIFAHAYFHHREAFEQAEVESSLYARFLALSSKFELVPPEFLPIPPEAFAGHHEEDEEVGPRGLDAAGLEPHPSSSIAQQPQHQESGPYTRDSLTLQVPAEPFQGGTPSPPGLHAENSPRKVGRNRTDTMVPSDVAAILRSPLVDPTDKEQDHEEVEEEEEVIPKEEETIPPPPAEEKPEPETEEPSTESDEESEPEEPAPTEEETAAIAAEEKGEPAEEATKDEPEPVPSEPTKVEESPSEPAPVEEPAAASSTDAKPEGESEKAAVEDKGAAEDAEDEKEVAEEVLGVTPAAVAAPSSETTTPAASVDEEKEKSAEAPA